MIASLMCCLPGTNARGDGDQPFFLTGTSAIKGASSESMMVALALPLVLAGALPALLAGVLPALLTGALPALALPLADAARAGAFPVDPPFAAISSTACSSV